MSSGQLAAAGAEFERAGAVPAPETADSEEFAIVLQTLARDFADEVHRGVGEVQRVGTQLDQVLEHVQTLTPQMETVSHSMNLQTEGARQIAEAATRFGDFSRATTEAQRKAWTAVEEFEATADGEVSLHKG